MTLKKITDADLRGVGVIGMADTPNLSALEMQEKVEETVRKVVIPVLNENVDNTASKEDLAKAVFNSGAGDMMAEMYDSDLDGCVNNADNGIFYYVYSAGTLTGTGVNGKFRCSESGTYTTLNVNGIICDVKCGEENEIELVSGAWYTFILDGATINFKQGGAGLNFKVVGGTTRPASPKENTIWINTSTAITSWQFSPTQPSTAPDGTALKTGDVWIKTGVSSSMSFDMLKKNTVEIFIVGCYQWDGSSFVEKTVKGYINGGWISSTIYLFTNGAAQVTWTKNQHTGLVDAGVSNGLLYFGEKYGSNGDSGNGSYHTDLIDLTNISYIYFNVAKVSKYGNTNFNPRGYISKTANEYSNSGTRVAESESFASAGLKVIDVRNCTGKYYVGITAWNTYDGESWSYVYLDNIYMI